MATTHPTDYPAGTRIFYSGDAANRSATGTVKANRGDGWLVVSFDDGRCDQVIPAALFGTGRFMTLAAREAQFAREMAEARRDHSRAEVLRSARRAS